MKDNIIHGVNCTKIGQGLYEILEEQDNTTKACLAFGMLPAEFMENVKKQVAETMARKKAEQLSVPELAQDFQEALRPEALNKVMHAISVSIYTAASESGRLIV